MMKCSVVILFSLIYYANSAKILGLFPLPSKSHHILGSALLKELANRGHDVTMISPFPLKHRPKRYEDVYMRGLLEMKNEYMEKFLQSNQTKYGKMHMMYNNFKLFTRTSLENKDLHDFLKEGRKYDLVIQLMVFMNEAFLGVGHSVNATTIGFSVIGSTPMSNYFMGNPSPYAYVPNIVGALPDDMTFLERVMNTLVMVSIDFFTYFVSIPYQEGLLKELFPSAPPLRELIEDVDLMLINSHFSTETPRPYLPNLIQIGGFHLEEKQILPADVENFLNTSKHGVVYFSLGSNAKSSQLPIETQHHILEAFRIIKYDVLWIYDGELENKPKNLMISKWAPQRGILGHDNVKAFITHGGLGSTVESIYFGKPMICIPLFGDQFKNSVDSVSKGYAIELNKDDITKEVLAKAINEIIDNPVYKDKIELKSDIYRNQYVNPMDKAVFWVEHALKHKGAKHLKSRAAYLPWYQYLLLDVISFISIVILLAITISYYIFKMVLRLCCCKARKLKTQ